MQIKGAIPSRQFGFTLVELMIVVVVVAILASIAIPSYTDYVTRARRANAQQQMLRFSTEQEQFFMDNKTYATSLASLGYAASVVGADDDGDLVGFLDEDMQYAFILWPRDRVGTTSTYMGYQIVGISWGVQRVRDYDCGWLYLEEDGNKFSSGTDTECW